MGFDADAIAILYGNIPIRPSGVDRYGGRSFDQVGWGFVSNVQPGGERCIRIGW